MDQGFKQKVYCDTFIENAVDFDLNTTKYIGEVT